MSERLSKMLVGLVLPVLTVVLLVGPVLAFWGRLPDPMATGWNGGDARSPQSPSTFLAIQAVVAAVCGALFLLGGLQRFATPIYNGIAAIIAASLAPTFAVVALSVTFANRDLEDWRAAENPGWVWIVAAMILPLIAILFVGWLMRATFLTRSGEIAEPVSAGLSLSETQSAAWHGQANARWALSIGGPLIAMGLVGLVVGLVNPGGLDDLRPGALIAGLSCFISGLIALAFTSAKVSVDRRGLTVTYGLLPWPKSRIALDTVLAAVPINVRPMHHGGWGYRGSRRLFGKAAVVIRAGEGMRVDLADGTEFVVTVDDAERGAGVLNDLRAAGQDTARSSSG